MCAQCGVERRQTTSTEKAGSTLWFYLPLLQHLAHGCWCHAGKYRQSVKPLLSQLLQQRPYAEYPIAVLAKAL